jgi:molybdate transport system substrate-binding protein
MKLVSAAAIGVLSMATLAGAAGAAEISVMSSNAFRAAYSQLVPEFEKASGHKVVTIFAGGVDVAKRIGAGETVDLVISAGPAIDGFIKDGKLVAGSRVDLAKSGVGVAVPAGAPKIDIGSSDGLKKALLGAKSIAYSTGPSGVYLVGLFDKWGIGEQVKPKLKQVAVGVPVGEIVARGEAEIGFQQVSELLPVKGIDYLGPLPADIQHITVFSVGLHAAARQAEAAKALVKFLTSPDAAPVIKKSGMEPG